MNKFNAHDVGALAFFAMMVGFAAGTIVTYVYGKEAGHLAFAFGMCPFAAIGTSALLFHGYKTNWR